MFALLIDYFKHVWCENDHDIVMNRNWIFVLYNVGHSYTQKRCDVWAWIFEYHFSRNKNSALDLAEGQIIQHVVWYSWKTNEFLHSRAQWNVAFSSIMYYLLHIPGKAIKHLIPTKQQKFFYGGKKKLFYLENHGHLK